MTVILPRVSSSASTEELLVAASQVRDSAFGTRISFSPKVFIPLTTLCRDSCGYCTFAEPPARAEAPFRNAEEVLSIARAGARAGCHEALFTLGERPELRYPAAMEWLSERGYASTIGYLAAMAKLVLDETGLLPHANAGALYSDELATLRSVSPSQGMMIETLRADLDCHRGAPDKEPERRLATLDAAGELSIPFTTGILVGIGETEADRVEALTSIADSHRKHGHIQEVIVQNFLPKPGTAMWKSPACDSEAFLRAIALARLILPDSVHLQAPPNLSEDFGALLSAGIDDWGGVSPVTLDHVNPERPWPALDQIAEVTEKAGFELAPRLTIYPEFAANPDRWLDEGLHFAVMDRADAESMARDDPGSVFRQKTKFASMTDDGAEVVVTGDRSTQWYSGSPVEPRQIIPPAGWTDSDRTRLGKLAGPVAEVVAGVRLGQVVEAAEIKTLFGARGREVLAVAELADELRRTTVGDEITFVNNRNINYTNVCTFKCRFCGFSKGPLSLNLRGKPYLLTLEQMQERVIEAVDVGATEVCMQGGIHPDFDGDYYLDVCRAIKEVAPEMHVHGFTALEVTEGAKRLEEDLASYLIRLVGVGLSSLPGTAAEILSDDVREILCPDKINTEEWLEAHRTAHSVGLRSNITMMYGAVESIDHWVKHFLVTRDLQKETGGFTEFVGLPFVHMASPIYLQHKARRGPTFRENLLVHSVARITYNGLIDNIQCGWVKTGEAGVRQMLNSGCNDVGGTLMDENISRSAGAEHGQEMNHQALVDMVAPLGRPLVQRTTLYGRP